MEDDPFDQFLSNDYHWVVYYHLGCYVKACGFNSFIMYTSKGSDFTFPEGKVFRFCYKTQSYSELQLIDIIRKQSA